MRRPKIHTLIKIKKQTLKAANPKSRERIRLRLKALQVAELIKREVRAA